MFCNKCGKELKDGMQFCTNCGAVVESGNRINTANQGNQVYSSANQNDIPPMGTTEAKVYETEGSLGVAPKKTKKTKKSLKTRIIAIAVAAAFVVGSGLFVWLNPYANNWFMRTILNSEDYTRYVIGKNLKNISGNLTDEQINLIASAMIQGNTSYSYESGSSVEDFVAAAQCLNGSYDISAEVNINDKIRTLVEDYMDYDEAEMITWIEGLEASISMDSSGDKFGMGANIAVNGEDITTMNAAIDIKNAEAYISAPQIFNNAIKSAYPELEDFDYDEYVKEYQKKMEFVPTAKVTEEILTRYITCVLEQIDDVEEETEKLEVGDVSQRCAKLTINIDDKLCKDVAKAVLKEAKNDSQIKGIIKDAVESLDIDEDPDEVIKAFEEEIDYSLESLDEMETTGEDILEITLWVNSRGEITGFDMEPADSSGKFSVYDVKKGKKCASVIQFTDGASKVKFEGEGQIKKNKRSMNFTLEAMNMDIAEVAMRNVDEKSLKKGIFNGTVEIAIAEDSKSMASMYLESANIDDEIADMLIDSKIVIESSMESANKGKATALLLMDNEQIAKLKVAAQIGNGKVDVPSNAKEYADLEDLEDELNIDAFIDALEKAGAPSEIIEEIEDGLSYRY